MQEANNYRDCNPNKGRRYLTQRRGEVKKARKANQLKKEGVYHLRLSWFFLVPLCWFFGLSSCFFGVKTSSLKGWVQSFFSSMHVAVNLSGQPSYS